MKSIDSNENLKQIALRKTKTGIATKEALRAQSILYSERIKVRARIYDDYTGSILSDNEEIEDLIDIRLSLQSLSSLFENEFSEVLYEIESEY